MKKINKFKLNLQHFADGEGEGTVTSNGDEPNGTNSNTVDKTYSQSDVDNITSQVKENAAAKALEEFKASNEFKAYQEYLDSQKANTSELDTLKSKLTQAQEQIEQFKAMEQEHQTLKSVNELIRMGIDKDSVDYAMLDLQKAGIKLDDKDKLTEFVTNSKFNVANIEKGIVGKKIDKTNEPNLNSFAKKFSGINFD